MRFDQFIITNIAVGGFCVLAAVGLNHLGNPQVPAEQPCVQIQNLSSLTQQKQSVREQAMLALLTPAQKKLLPLIEQGMVVRFMTVTAYDAWSESSINVPEFRTGFTSIGRKAVVGRTIAVDPKIIPYGSKVFIAGIGWRVAEDTGGDIQGNRIDVLMHTEEQALNFGRKNMYVLWTSAKL